MADRKVPASTPVLRGPGDIFKAFHGLVLFRADELREKGAAIVSWSISGINAEAKAHGVKFDQVKDALRPKLFKALRALPGVAVEIMDTREQAARLTLVPVVANRNNGTRKAARSPPKAPTPPAAAKTRRSPSRSPPKAALAAAAAVARRTASRSPPKSELSAAAATAAAVAEVVLSAPPARRFKIVKVEVKETMAMVNLIKKLTPDNVDANLAEFLGKTPESEGGMKRVLETLLFDPDVGRQERHPELITFMKGMVVRHESKPYPIDPRAGLFSMLCDHLVEGSEGARLEATSHDITEPERFSLKKIRQKFIELGYLAGFMVRDQLLSVAQCEELYRILTTRPASEAVEVRNEREKDATYALFAMILRAGPRLSLTAEASAARFLAEAIALVGLVAEKEKSPLGEFARKVQKSMSEGWVVEESTQDAGPHIGAPLDLPVPKGAVPKAGLKAIAAVVKALPPEGLGPDPLELARRFPLVVRLDAIAKGVHAVEVHGKKMRERCAATGKSEKEILAAVFELVKNSAHFERVADPAGVPAGFLMAIRKKEGGKPPSTPL